MKWFLVVYFLVNGSWYPGEVVEPNGWSSREYPTKQECEFRRDIMNESFDASDAKGKMKGVCQTRSPNSI